MRERSSVLIGRAAAGFVLLLASAATAFAQSGPVAGDEDAIEAYLAMWSHNSNVDAAAVTRFYAPHVLYYGKHFTRAQVLADKLRYIRAFPVRRYGEVPGSIRVQCNGDRSRCRVSVVVSWRRVARNARVSTGRARIAFDFVPMAGGRKIARESAHPL